MQKKVFDSVRNGLDDYEMNFASPSSMSPGQCLEIALLITLIYRTVKEVQEHWSPRGNPRAMGEGPCKEGRE